MFRSGYDALNQLTGFKRGTLNATKDDIQGTPSRTQTWGLDEQGNWTTFSTNSVPQAREHNYQNQATRVGGNYLAFDNNGNTRTDENGRQYVYDAWDRLVEMKTSGGVRIARFSFDALGRRVTETDNGPAKDFYYSAQWQLLEERHSGAAKAQYVWSPVYVDALVLRDRNNDTNPDLEERRYVQQDANFNVTALTNPSGGVSERYVYDPYGTPTVLQANWTNYPVGQESGAYDWLYLHQGGRYFRFDVSAGTYHFRRRELSATLGRWMQVDPKGFDAGDTNLYRYVGGKPINATDPTGEDCPGCDIPDWAFGGQANSSPCALACCAEHDKCYFDNGCTAASWAWNAGGAAAGGALGWWAGLWGGVSVGLYVAELVSDCAKCNNEVVTCITACALPGNHMERKPLYFCAKTGKFITIGPDKDYADLKTAKDCCCT